MQRLPQGALDRLFLVREPPSAPWLLHLELVFRDRLAVAEIERALAVALGRHARLRAVLPSVRDGTWLVQPAGDHVAVEVLGEREAAEVRTEWLGQPLDLSRSCLRVGLTQAGGRDRLVIVIHHAATDGVGMARFASDLLAAYEGRTLDPVVPLDGQGDGAVAAPSAPRPGNPFGDVLRARPDRLAVSKPSEARDLSIAGVLTVPLPRCRVTGDANDVLLAAVHLALAEWNGAHGPPAGLLSVAVPVNSRPPGSSLSGVGNSVLAWPVVTNPDDRVPARVLSVVQAQTRKLKWGIRSPAVAAVADALSGKASLPLWARKSLQQTASLSYLGDTRRFFSLRDNAVTDVVASMPTAPSMPLCMLAWRFEGTNHLSARFGQPLDRHDASALLSSIVHHMTRVDTSTGGAP